VTVNQESKKEHLKMNLVKALACCAIAAAPMVSVAQDQGYNNPCAGIKWGLQFLHRYPGAAAACQTVETKDGIRYAQFKGKVVGMTPQSVTVAIENVAGTPRANIEWLTEADEDMMINDKEAKVADLKKGDMLTFWVQEGKMGASMRPGGHVLPFGKPTPIPNS
jgi:hypothetical protein